MTLIRNSIEKSLRGHYKHSFSTEKSERNLITQNLQLTDSESSNDENKTEREDENGGDKNIDNDYAI